MFWVRLLGSNQRLLDRVNTDEHEANRCD
jgi:hypothetical protein